MKIMPANSSRVSRVISLPKAWKQAAGLLRLHTRANNAELVHNRKNWDARLKKLKTLSHIVSFEFGT